MSGLIGTDNGCNKRAYETGLFADGSAAAPSISFAADTNLGFYRDGSDRIGFTSDGTQRWVADEDQIRNQVGSAALPSWSFAGDPDTGMYHPAADEVGFSAGGTLRASAVAQGIRSDQAGAAATPSVFWTGDIDTGLYHPAADEVGVSAGGTLRASVVAQGIRSDQAGAAATPSVFWTGDTNTGFYKPAADEIGASAGGTLRASVVAQGIRSDQAGSAAAPSVFWAGDVDTGLYHKGADNLGISCGGLVGEWGTGGLTVASGKIASLPGGAVGAPALSFTGDADTGLYSSAADTLDLAVGGGRPVSFGTGGLAMQDGYSYSHTSTATSGNELSITATPGSARTSPLAVFTAAGANWGDTSVVYVVNPSTAANALGLEAPNGGAWLRLYRGASNNDLFTVYTDGTNNNLNIRQEADIGSGDAIAFKTNAGKEMTASTAITQNFVNISGAINQSVTAGYNILGIDWTETATGSGDHRGLYMNAPAGFVGDLIKLDVNGVERFSVNEGGVVEINSTANINGWIGIRGSLANWGGIYGGTDDGVVFAISNRDGYSNNHLIITSDDNATKDHQHSTLSANPTVFFQSATDPTSNATEWFSQSFVGGGAGTGTATFTMGESAGLARAWHWDIPVAAGGAADAALDYQFKVAGTLEAGLLAETDGSGSYRAATWKIPYNTADYNADWSGYTAPDPASLTNGSMVLVHNSNGGGADRLYAYSGGGWHYIDFDG